jgi:Fe-S cluster assembly protein SufD
MSEVLTKPAAIESPLVSAMAESFQEIYGTNANAHLADARRLLNRLEWPTTKTEFWKYTRTGKLTKNSFSMAPASAAGASAKPLGEVESYTLLFENGRFLAQNSDELPAGVSFQTFEPSAEFPQEFNSLAQPDIQVFETLNTAFMPQLFVLRIAAHQVIEKPIRLAYHDSGSGIAAQYRVIIVAEKGCKAEVIQSFDETAGVGFTNALSEIFVGENASFQFYKIQDEGNEQFHHSSDYVKVAAGANFGIHTFSLSSAWTRNNLVIKMAGPSAFARLNGLYIPTGERHVDNNTFVDHAVPHCDSSELYKGVLYDRSTGVFNGKVIVRQDAQKTNAFQQNNNLILSENAQMNSKPELEIYADDVKCSHGSTTGQLDDEALFYLQSRAIGRNEAQRMLTSAFGGEVLNQVENEALREYLYQKFEL